METNENMPESVESPGESSQAGKRPSLYSAMNWKTVVLFVVILLAGAVAAHSLLTNGRGNTTCTAGGGSSVWSCCPQASADGGCPPDKRCCPAGKCLESPETTANPQCNKPCPNSPEMKGSGCWGAAAASKE